MAKRVNVNMDAVNRALRTLNKSALAKDPAKLRTFTLLLKDEIGKELSVPGTGKPYRRRNFNKKRQGPLLPGKKRYYAVPGTRGRKKEKAGDFHIASKPGAPPARDLGHLFRSRFVDRMGQNKYLVGVSAKYAEALQFGLRFAARPFMHQALERALRAVRLLR